METVIDRRPDLAVLSFGLLLTYVAAFQMFKLPAALPVMIAEYGYERAVAGAFMSVYAVAGLLLSIPVGRWIQQGHPKPVIYAGLAAMLTGNALCLHRPDSSAMMLLGRGLEGVAYTVMGVAGPVLVNGQAPPGRYPMVISLLSLWIPIGQVAAVLVYAAMPDEVGWHGVWWAGSLLTMGTLIWCAVIRLPGVDVPPMPTRHLSQGEGNPAAGKRPASERFLLFAVTLVFLLWTGQYYAYMTWLPQYLVEVHGFSLSASNAGYLAPVLVIVVFNIATGFLLRMGVRIGVLFSVGASLQAVAWWMIPWTDTPVYGLLSLLIYGAAAGISPTCLFGMTGMVAARSGSTAAGFGLVMSGRNIGVLAGPILIGYLFTLSGTWNGVSPVFAAI
ncbi:MAG: MFS transporter, partial [candidate division Zixibacteria bacterium]|nr:MFS transporter [candidate division Zixibacteria bacterium]